MDSINDAYINGLLADASYANGLATGDTGTVLSGRQDLVNRMTPTLAKFIGDNFSVVTSINTPDDSGSGFDAVVWRGNAGSP